MVQTIPLPRPIINSDLATALLEKRFDAEVQELYLSEVHKRGMIPTFIGQFQPAVCKPSEPAFLDAVVSEETDFTNFTFQGILFLSVPYCTLLISGGEFNLSTKLSVPAYSLNTITGCVAPTPTPLLLMPQVLTFCGGTSDPRYGYGGNSNLTAVRVNTRPDNSYAKRIKGFEK